MSDDYAGTFEEIIGETEQEKAARVNGNGAAASTEASGPLFDPWERYIVPPFPFDILPPTAQDHVAAQSAVIGCDGSALAMAVLATFSGALHHGFAVKMMRNGPWYERPRLWVLLVADPSQLKTPIINAATAPLTHYETHLRVKYEADLRDYELALTEKEEGDPPPRKPDPPPRYIVWDTTVEKLGELLARSDKGLLVKSDEISGWLGNMERYNTGPFRSRILAMRLRWRAAQHRPHQARRDIHQKSIGVPARRHPAGAPRRNPRADQRRTVAAILTGDDGLGEPSAGQPERRREISRVGARNDLCQTSAADHDRWRARNHERSAAASF